MRAPASRARPSATASSTRPAPAAIVSAACASALSPSATAAAMPPCAQARRGALAERRGGDHGDRTRRELQRAEQAGEAAADDDDVVDAASEVMTWLVMFAPHSWSSPRKLDPYAVLGALMVVRCRHWHGGYGSRLALRLAGTTLRQLFRLIIRSTERRALSAISGSIGDFLAQVDEAVENLRQRDALHVRAEVARPHELDVRQFGLHVVGHRAFGDHHHALRAACCAPSRSCARSSR